MLARLITEERGADATEYALLAALIAVAMIASVTAIGTKLNGNMNTNQASM
jgi:pilus assembly protein Flp/PilA